MQGKMFQQNAFPTHPYFNVYRLFDDMLTNGNTFLSRELDPMPISVEKKIKAANPNYFCTAILAFGYRGLTF